MTISEAFWQRINKETGKFCWSWTGQKNQRGYGRIRGKFAHRVSWEIHNGEIPVGKFICHTCDNPECCNPDHLFLGTAYDNNIDRAMKSKRVRVKALGVGLASPSNLQNTLIARNLKSVRTRRSNKPQTWPDAIDGRNLENRVDGMFNSI